MDRDWILQTKETRRVFSKSTWVPLRASMTHESGDAQQVGHTSEYFGCGSVAFPPEHREAAEKLGWTNIGAGHNVRPFAYEDGYYASIEQYQYHDKEPIGVNLVFEHPQPVVGGRVWILNPDLVVALRLVKQGTNWVRPEEDFVVVAREILDEDGHHRLIEIKREFLIDYLAARNLALRLSYYRQRVENVVSLETSPYVGLASHREARDGGQFELLVRTLNDLYGGTWASFRAWRTDVDEEEDAPVMGPEREDNTDHETAQGERTGLDGVRVEGELWRDEWIEHQGKSVRVRGDDDENLPQFIVETDGARMPSRALDHEDIGRWLWFRSPVVTELLSHRGFALEWYTAETGAIRSTSGHATHFGINSTELITVYAYDIARLNAWEQHVWAAHNVVPEGKVSGELLASQVKVQPADTHAVEKLLFKSMSVLEAVVRKRYGIPLFTHDVEDNDVMQQISRFASKDRSSLLRLAKELVRVFSDRINVRALRTISKHAEKDKLGSNKLLQDVLAQEVGAEAAREAFGVVAGVYDMRVGDAHPTSSNIGDALKLAGIDESLSFLKQGEQLIANFGYAIWRIGRMIIQAKPR